MTKISFKTLIADVNLPLSMGDYTRKCDEITALLNAGEITAERARGLKATLQNNVGDEVKNAWANKRHEAIVESMKTLSTLMYGTESERRAIENKAANDFRDWIKAADAKCAM